MRLMRSGFVLVSAVLLVMSYSKAAMSKGLMRADTYKVNLFFSDSSAYEDELTLVYKDGEISGTMHVPNDFDAPIEDAKFGDVNQDELSFHITLPPKYDKMFPGGLYYRLQFRRSYPCVFAFCPSERVLDDFIGKVEVREQVKTRFIGYVVGFKKVVSR